MGRTKGGHKKIFSAETTKRGVKSPEPLRKNIFFIGTNGTPWPFGLVTDLVGLVYIREVGLKNIFLLCVFPKKDR